MSPPNLSVVEVVANILRDMIRFLSWLQTSKPHLLRSQIHPMQLSPVSHSSAVRSNGRLCACIVTTFLLLWCPFNSSGRDNPGLILMLFQLADEGNASAQYELGNRCEEGRGVDMDYAEAFLWYRLAAEQGHAHAQHKLGTLYHQGKGVEQDYAEAANWYRKAAEKGVPEAQHNLGVMFYGGEGLPQDYAEAFRWFQEAAKLGLPEAQHHLAIMYANGEGVAADFDKAVSWLRKSAAQGYAKSQQILQRMGMPQEETTPLPLDSQKITTIAVVFSVFRFSLSLRTWCGQEGVVVHLAAKEKL